MNSIAKSPAEVKSELMKRYAALLDRLFARAESGDRPRALELGLWCEMAFKVFRRERVTGRCF